MKTVNVKDIRYDYGKFYVRSTSEEGGSSIQGGMIAEDDDGIFRPQLLVW